MYPQLLREIPDPPLVLYVRGTLPDFTDRVSVSIVGTRKCTRYGKQAAWHFAGNLAQRGVIIVSGMARLRCRCMLSVAAQTADG